MTNESKLSPVSIVIFGATGDLVWHKLAPALYNLLLNQQLPEHFAVIGIGRKNESSDEFQLRLRDGANSFGGGVDEKTWNGLLPTYPIFQAILTIPQPTLLWRSNLKSMKRNGAV